MHSRHSKLGVVEPFRLALAVEFLRGFGPMVGEVTLGAGSLTKGWMHRGQVVVAHVRQQGAHLSVKLESQRKIADETARAVSEKVTSFVSAEEDLEEFHAIAESDLAFAPVARRLRGLHHVKFPTPFEAACWGVINQRVARSRARSMKAAIVRKFGAIEHDAFPEAEALADVSETDIRRLIGSERKARAVASVARAFAKVDPKFLSGGPLAEVERWLRRIYGVGDFTSGFVLYRGLGRFVRLPGSPKFLAAARYTYGSRFSAADAEKIAAKYGKWGGQWSLYLWAATFVRS